MWQIEIGTTNGGMSRRDHVEGDAKTPTYIDQSFEVVETFVVLKNFFHDNSCLIGHCLVENLIEPRILSRIFKCMRTMYLVKWNTSFKNRIF